MTSVSINEQVTKPSLLYVWQLLGLVAVLFAIPGAGPLLGFGIGLTVYDFVTREQPGHRRAFRIMALVTLGLIVYLLLAVNVGSGHSSNVIYG